MYNEFMKMKLYSRMMYLLNEGFTLLSTFETTVDGIKSGIPESYDLTYNDVYSLEGAITERFENVIPHEYRQVKKLWRQINSNVINNGGQDGSARKVI